MTRTSLALAIAAAALAACAASDSSPPTDGAPASAERGPVLLTDRARALHASALVVDGHNDLPWQIRNLGNSSFDELDIAQPRPELHTDIARLREGGLGAQFWSVYVPSTSDQPQREVRRQMRLVRQMVARYPDVFELAYSTEDIERCRAAGRIASMIGIEGGHAIENSLDTLRSLYDAGARYMTLTHADTLDWADSATDEPRSGGLSPFGEQVVRTMNELGMLVDISHVSVETMTDVLRVSSAPVIASHSCAYALAAHPRNIPDDVLEALPGNGGVIMVNFYSGFVVAESARKSLGMFEVMRQLRRQYGDDERAIREARLRLAQENPLDPGTVRDVVDHIDHIARVAGIDHVGLGSDYDGVTLLPAQLEDVSCYPFLTQELLDRGYTDEEVRKVLGGNVMRAFREAERVSRELSGGPESGPGSASGSGD